MTRLDFARAGAAAPVLAGLALAALAVLAGRALARRRSVRLLGAAAAPVGGGAGDALLLLALAAVGLALLGPRFGEHSVRIPATGVDVAVLFDVSLSMRARDVAPSRLERARALAGAVLARLEPGDRAALAAFAGRGVLLTPLTPDKEALRALLPALDESLLAEGGSRLDLGVRAALRAFRFESARPRLILLLSDGEDPERGAAGQGALAPAGVRVVAVVLGSEAGAAVPSGGAPLRDASGHSVVSRADPERLRALIDPTDGALIGGDRFGAVDAGEVLAALRRDAGSGGEGFILRRVPRSGAPALAALALVALLLETRLTRRPAAALRPLLVPATRRARSAAPALAVAALVLLQARAGGADDPKIRGLEARLRHSPEDARALVRLGVARGRAGELLEAERAFFAAAVRADEPRLAADAYYDLGVGALERGDLETARDVFFDAIALAPGDRIAQFNLEWTLRALARLAGDKGKDSERDDPSKDLGQGEPDPDAKPESEPEPRPHEAEAAPRDEPSGERPRENPVQLDAEAARRWLEAVADDPARALQAAARARGREAAAPGSEAPRW